jgi:transposase-like protein
MSTTKKRLVDPAVKQAVIADYQAGKRVLDIEQEHGVNRATLYWILDEAGVMPSRSNRGERYRGTTEDLARLYELIQAQEQHIERLEQRLSQYESDQT